MVHSVQQKMRIFHNNKISGNEELMLVIFNCTLLHNQNDRWTVPYPYLMVCCKNIYLRILFKEYGFMESNRPRGYKFRN
jgi:hypothetical protein